MKREQWSAVAAGMVISGICICGCLTQNQAWKSYLCEPFLVNIEKSVLPAFFYKERKRVNVNEWIAKQALEMISLEGYVEKKMIVQAEIEDEETKVLMDEMAEKHVEKKEEPEPEQPKVEVKEETKPVEINTEQLRDFQYLISHYYTVDSTTMIGPEQLNVDELLAKNMHIDKNTEGPKVLIFHTHSQEAFADSTSGDPNTSIVGVGEYLTELLNAKGISTMHHDGVYDLVNGKLDRSKAYEYSENGVRKILQEHPSIEVVIDLHRDGVGENTRLVTQANGKDTAKIMFFNGLSRTKKQGDIAYLKNPYIQDNLSFSLQMQLAAEQMYPGFARKIYLKGYRYSLHMKPKSLLIEAGAQTNTVQEMKNAMELLSDVLVKVIG